MGITINISVAFLGLLGGMFLSNFLKMINAAGNVTRSI
jgi:hypothetical protein